MPLQKERQSPGWRRLLPGSLGSLIVHLLVVLVAGMSLRGCQKASSGERGGERYRDVGLFVVDGVDGGAADAGLVPGAGDDTQTQQAQDQTSDANLQNLPTSTDASQSFPRLPDEAPDLSELLNISPGDSTTSGDSSSTLPPLIGPGPMIGGSQRSSSGGGSSLIQPQEAGGAAKVGGTGGPGNTSFMDIAGVGKSFVYVIDTSSSMHGSRLKIAQSQLKASLRLLQPNQKFAVIFYNEYTEHLKLRGRAAEPMYFATELNKQLASHEVDRITSDRGTEHKPALLEALSLKPDVIYFLTDGDEPELNAADLRDIERRNGTTTIHVIKFGDGSLTSRATSWLEILARQSNGEFREIRAGS